MSQFTHWFSLSPSVKGVIAERRDFNYNILLNILHHIGTHSAPPTNTYLQPKRRLPHTNFQTLGARPGETHKQHHTWYKLRTRSGSHRPTTTLIARAIGQLFKQLANLENAQHSRHSLAPRVKGVLRPVGGFPTTRTSRRSRDTHTRSRYVTSCGAHSLMPETISPTGSLVNTFQLDS